MAVKTFDIQSSDPFLSVSDAAAAHFKKQVDKGDSVGIRVSLKQAGCTGYKYVVEEIQEVIATDMALVLANGVRLFIDSRYLTAVRGAEIDVRQQGLNLNLVVENPNVKDECGCGESFSIQE